MSYRLDCNDAFHDDPYYDEREEARTTPGGEEPPDIPTDAELHDLFPDAPLPRRRRRTRSY